MRCDQCKHWKIKGDDPMDSPPRMSTGGITLGVCTRAIPFWDASEWSGEDGGDDWRAIRKLKPEYEGRKFFAQDGSDFHATVYTAPDFFCAEFEPF